MVSASPLPPPPPASRAFPSSVPAGQSLLRPSTQLPFERPDPHDEESATLIRKRDGTADPSASFSSSSLGGDVPLDAALALGSSSSTSTVPMNPTGHLAHSTTISDVHFIAGNHADFYLLGSKGIGGSESLALVKRALQEQRPDVLLVQICPTRLRLLLDPDASIWSYLIDIHAAISSNSSGQALGVEGGFSPYHMLAGATPLLNFSRFSSLVLARLVWKAVAVLVGQRRTFAHEFVQSILGCHYLRSRPPHPCRAGRAGSAHDLGPRLAFLVRLGPSRSRQRRGLALPPLPVGTDGLPGPGPLPPLSSHTAGLRRHVPNPSFLRPSAPVLGAVGERRRGLLPFFHAKVGQTCV